DKDIAQKGYGYGTLVAFSGTVSDPESGPDDFDVYGFRRSLTVRYRDMVHGQSGGASLSVCRKQPSLSLIPM
ncbi:MAG: hypothetical protein WAO90_15265, partial [Mycobacterium sp.]